MPSVNGNIEIGRNCIRYYDEDLKISSISRTWIFRFQNKEKIAFENAKRDYEKAKRRYETEENVKRVKKHEIILLLQ